MTSLADHVQSVALDALDPEREAKLEQLRPALRALRADYGSGVAPDFSDSSTRAAYVFGYHPHHCVLAAEALAAIGTSLLGFDGRNVVRVTVLGAGPAPELVALAWMFRTKGVRIEADLVDREAAWLENRRTTVDTTVGPWPVDVSATHHTADLQDPTGLDLASRLVRDADLVIAQAVLTELAAPADNGQILDHLTRHVGARTRLVVLDFDRSSRTQEATKRLDSDGSNLVLTTARFELPACRPVAPLASHFYAESDGLRPRRKLQCALRVIARPGALSPGPQQVELTNDQAAALSAFRKFLQSDDQVFVLRGGAGTGKTTLFPSLVQESASRELPVVLLAPTGRAARRLKDVVGRAGSTIHSQLYQYDSTEPRSDAEDPPLDKFILRVPPPEPAVYVVDEASLIGNKANNAEDLATAEVVFGNGRLLSDLLSTCLHASGSRIVFVGDPDQLPPIGEDVSPALDLGQLERLVGSRPMCSALNEVVRQGEESKILDLARAWLVEESTPTLCRQDPEGGIDLLHGSEVDPWLMHEVQELRAAIVAGRNADVRTWNNIVRDQAGLGDQPPSRGERLLVIRTDARTGLLNGDEVEILDAEPTVEVVRLRGDQVTLRKAQLALATAAGPVAFDAILVDDLLPGAAANVQRTVSRVLYVDFIRRSGLRPGMDGFNDAYAKDERVHALRATYAYARTCHRAQGGEWDHVVVDFTGSRAFGSNSGRWRYTALTRARRVVHLANTGESVFDTNRLLSEASELLDTAGITVVGHRRIQHGLQLTLERSDANVDVNLFLKGGLPSKCTPSGRDAGGLQQDAVAALQLWAEERRTAGLPPLPKRLEKHGARLAAVLSQQGYDVRAVPRAEYQVTFSVDAPKGGAAITYHHKASGELGTELSQSGGGDLTALATLRAAIEATRD